MRHYITDQREALASTEIINKYKYAGLDIETNGLDVFESTILLVQITVPDDDLTTYIYDARVLNMKEILNNLSNEVIYILHNGKFDLKFLRHNYGFLPSHLFDTMLAETLLTCGIGKLYSSLNDLTNKYLGYGLVKEIRNSFAEQIVFFSDEQLNYAADDAIAEVRLYPILAQKLVDLGLERVSSIEFRLTRVLVDMELVGVKFDEGIWKSNIDKTLVHKKASEETLRNLYSKVGNIEVKRKQKGVEVIDTLDAGKINLNSYQQVLPVLAAFGINVSSTSFETLSNIDHPAAKALLEYRKYAKRLNAFGQSYIDDYVRGGRVHAGVGQIGTYTGRFAYESPNLQQVINPKKDKDKDVNYRTAFIADDGYLMLKCDYSQIELRLATEISQESEFIKAYENGLDLHTLTASKVFHIPYDEVDHEGKDRTIAKNINFASLYGSGPSNLVAKFQISMKEAVRILDEFHHAYPQLSRTLQSLGDNTVINGYAKTIFGRRRNFQIPSFSSSDFFGDLASIKREGTNHAIQGSSADMTKLAMVNLYDNLIPYGGQLLITVHDEIVSQVPEEFGDIGAEAVIETMLDAGRQMIHVIPVEVDLLKGHSWGG